MRLKSIKIDMVIQNKKIVFAILSHGCKKESRMHKLYLIKNSIIKGIQAGALHFALYMIR